MVIVYESKTGFTRKYAEMLAAKTGFKALPAKEFLKEESGEEVVFLGWMKVGKIQGLNKMRKCNVRAVCATGTARTAEPSIESVMERNNIKDVPFFYLRGGCLPLKEFKGINKILLSMFVKMLKARKDTDEETEEAIANIENGFDGVNEAYLEPVIEWLRACKEI